MENEGVKTGGKDALFKMRGDKWEMNSHLSTLNSNLSIKNTDSEIAHLSDFHSRKQVFLTNERKSCP